MNEVLFTTQGITVRPISPDEKDVLKEAVVLNNLAWGERLKATLEEFVQRARNGWLIGAFKGEVLEGTISTLGGRSEELEMMDEDPAHPYWKWDWITSNGTFRNSDPEGDILFCVAVTSRPKGSRRPFQVKAEGKLGEIARRIMKFEDLHDPDFRNSLMSLADAVIHWYVESGLDYVLRFHQRPKGGGVIGGARVVKVLPQGRPLDADSLGYNVILSYPEVSGPLPPSPTVNSIGEALVLGAAYFVAQHPTLRIAAPYSRPAQLRENLAKALAAASGQEIERPREHFWEFVELLKQAAERVF